MPDSNFIFFVATKKTKKRKLDAALGTSYSMRSGGKSHQHKPLAGHASPVIAEALEDLFSSARLIRFEHRSGLAHSTPIEFILVLVEWRAP